MYPCTVQGAMFDPPTLKPLINNAGMELAWNIFYVSCAGAPWGGVALLHASRGCAG
jgi:hypothetical protein